MPCTAADTFNFPVSIVPQCIDTDRNNELREPVAHKTTSSDWSHTGVVVKDNPGMIPDTWYLMHDQPGEAAVIIELIFASGDICTSSTPAASCLPLGLENGTRVRVDGEHVLGDIVHVRNIEVLH